MAFAGNMNSPRKRTAAEEYEAWLDGLPEADRVDVDAALYDRQGWSNKLLKPRLESDKDYPAPEFGMTAFREWRASYVVQ